MTNCIEERTKIKLSFVSTIVMWCILRPETSKSCWKSFNVLVWKLWLTQGCFLCKETGWNLIHWNTTLNWDRYHFPCFFRVILTYFSTLSQKNNFWFSKLLLVERKRLICGKRDPSKIYPFLYTPFFLTLYRIRLFRTHFSGFERQVPFLRRCTKVFCDFFQID